MLALGTAQFGQCYGIANQSGQVTAQAVTAILARALQAGLDTLDTAIAYGESEETLGRVGVTSWQVITKLPKLPDGISNVSQWVNEQVSGSLKRLNLRQLSALLLHSPSDLFGPRGQDCIAALADLKTRGHIRAAGISIYDPSELDAIWPVWRPDLVQAPLNVLDQRLYRSGWLSKLLRHGVRVHVRSAFLQGLLLMPADQRPAWFNRWRGVLDSWLEWCLQHRVTPLQGALQFLIGRSEIERIVVGVDSVAQLEEILAASTLDLSIRPPDSFFLADRELIEPSRWRLS